MKLEQRIRDFSLWLISILVWFEILWAVVLFVGSVFQWSGLTEQLASAFLGSGFCGLIVLAALALLNVTVNLNIISKAQMHQATGVKPAESKPSTFIRTLVVAGALISLVVSALWLAEWRLYKSRMAAVMNKLESVAETTFISEAIELIETDGKVKDLADIREALSASILSGGRLSIILPQTVKGVTVYYELTAWWHGMSDSDEKISSSGLTKFVPRKEEQDKFEKLADNTITQFAVPSAGTLRAFRRVETKEGHLILLIDTSRRSDYSRCNFR